MAYPRWGEGEGAVNRQFLSNPLRNRIEAEQAITPIEVPALYNVSVPQHHQQDICYPVNGCQFYVRANQGTKRTRHPENSIVIQEEGRLPQCSLCGFCGWMVNSEEHRATQVCARQTATRRNYFQAKHQQEACAAEFTVARETIEQVLEFRYLGRILTNEDDDNRAVAWQLTRDPEK